VPLYEFRCKKCTTVFEKLCRVGENGKTVACTACGARNAQRLMSVFAAHVAGGSSSRPLRWFELQHLQRRQLRHCH